MWWKSTDNYPKGEMPLGIFYVIEKIVVFFWICGKIEKKRLDTHKTMMQEVSYGRQ